MRIVELLLQAPNRSAADVYETLSDFGGYPALCDAVQNVTVSSVADTVTISRWEVKFRAGTLRWLEEDTFNPVLHSITFRQLEGDVALFDGSWQCADTDGGATISFTARLDMGIPSLADALEPIAARTLVENTVSIVSGLFGDATVVSSHIGVPATVGELV